jgi:hypothetical protein
MIAQAARKDRPETHRKQPGRPFTAKNPGKPKGARDRRTVVGVEICQAMAGRASDRLVRLIDSRSARIAFEASRLCLAYAWGSPRQTLELVGGVGDLSREITALLQEARARRVPLEAPLPVTLLSAAPGGSPALPAAPASALDAEPLTSEKVSYPKSEPPPAEGPGAPE